MSENKRIGIVGGGQLAQMMTQSAMQLGYSVTVVDPTENCPASTVGATQIVADYKDASAVEELSEKTDVITIDFEHINTEILQKLADTGKSVQPSPATVKMIQDKLTQCDYLSENNLPLADYEAVETKDQASSVLKKFGGKAILKRRFQSYDGKGNAVVLDDSELKQAWDLLGRESLYMEKLIPFVKELSVIVARDQNGKLATYPVVETIHVNNICHEVFMPAPVEADILQKAKDIADNAVVHLKGSGVFAIEMFLTKENEILINEIAPRVHNSGHLTIEANETSQFEQHVRAVSGMELGSTAMKVPASVMINILGERNGTSSPEGVSEAEQLGQVKVHLYNKHDVKVGRKMGHITATADTLEEAKSLAEQAYSLVKI